MSGAIRTTIVSPAGTLSDKSTIILLPTVFEITAVNELLPFDASAIFKASFGVVVPLLENILEP